MELLGKSQTMAMATPEGIKILEENNIDINEYRFVPMVGFTMPEFGWHLKEENFFFKSFKNPKTAYRVAYWLGELFCFNPFKTGKGIFHKVAMIKKGEKLDKKIEISSLGA